MPYVIRRCWRPGHFWTDPDDRVGRNTRCTPYDTDPAAVGVQALLVALNRDETIMGMRSLASREWPGQPRFDSIAIRVS